MSERPTDITTLLHQAQAGAPGAQDRLVIHIYDELRDMARQLMHRERPNHTLQPTDLVNEALARLIDADALSEAANRRWLFASAARAMRQVLVDHARSRAADKRGGHFRRIPLDDTLAEFAATGLDVLDLHDGLSHLARLHERQASVVEMRYFGGFKVEEIARTLAVSVSLVEGDLRKALAFLRSRDAEE